MLVPGSEVCHADSFFSPENRRAQASGRNRQSCRLELEVLENRVVPTASQDALNQAFINQAFQDLVNHGPDATALAASTAFLNSGHSRQDLALVIESAPSHEFYMDEVNQVYQQILQRPADAAGLNAFTSLLANGGYLQQVEATLTGSSEFFNTQGGGTFNGWLTALYQDWCWAVRSIRIGLANAQQVLANGYTLSQIALGIYTSPEYYTNLVQGYFQQYLNRPAGDSGIALNVTALEQGQHPETVIAVIIGSDEYFGQFTQSVTTVTAAPTPSVVGQSVTITSTVAPVQSTAGTPTGTVDFTDTTTGTDLGTASLTAGQAMISTSSLSVCAHNIVATYSGDGFFNGSANAVAQTVDQAATVTAVTSSAIVGHRPGGDVQSPSSA